MLHGINNTHFTTAGKVEKVFKRNFLLYIWKENLLSRVYLDNMKMDLKMCP
jgi:hypothetical protein